MPEEINQIRWGRSGEPDSSIEVSTAGLSEYSALRARFAPGTVLGRFDISGMTVETVYQDIIKRSGKGLPPGQTSYLHRDDLHGPEAEEYSYYEGYLPLWTIWADQHPDLVENLREMVGEGGTLTDKYARTEVSQARALADILNGRGHYFDRAVTGDFFTRPLPQPKWDPEMNYDVYTVGMGRRSLDEFLSLIPPGTRKVVDTRNWTQNTERPYFNRLALRDELRSRGIEYEWARDLSGKPRAGEKDLYAEEDLFLPQKQWRVDYSKMMGSERFRGAYDRLRNDISQGGVLIVSNEENAIYSSRALLVGQRLSRDGVSVGHVDGMNDVGYMVRSQDDVARDALRRDILVSGEARDIDFYSDRSTRPNEKVRLMERALPGNSSQERTVDRGANYGTEVSYTVLHDLEPERSRGRRSREKLRAEHEAVIDATIHENARRADVTLLFTRSSTEIPVASFENGSMVVRVSLPWGPDSRDRILEPEWARRVMDKAYDQITWKLLGSSWQQEGLDLSSIRLNIAGSNLAALANQFVEEAVSEAELSRRDVRRLVNTGLSLEDQTGITQDDLNEALRNCVGELIKPREVNTEFEGRENAWQVGQVITNGESGIAEAATLAAQYHGIPADIGTTERFRITADNESREGVIVTDEVMFKNRFRMGLRREVTQDDIKDALDMAEYRRDRQEMTTDPGLTDRQILILQELGFSNTELVDLYELALNNKIVISDNDDLLNLVDNAAGYGIEGAGFVSLPAIDSAARRVDVYLENAKAQGYGVLTIASDAYPAQLREFKEYTVTEEKLRLVDHDGATSVETVPETVTMKRPAVLWYQGVNPSIADGRGVTFIGENDSVPEALSAARVLTAKAVENELVTMGSLEDGPSLEALREAVRRDGVAVALSPDPIDAEERADLQGEISRKGGVTFSEVGPNRKTSSLDSGYDRDQQSERAKKVSATLSKATAFVSGLTSGQKMSAVGMAAWALYGLFAVSYKGFASLADTVHKTQAERNTAGVGEMLKAGKASSLSPDGEDFGIIPAAVDDVIEGPAETAAKDSDKTLHPRELPVEVIHYGNRHVFLVDGRYPDVIETIRKTFPDAAIADPGEREKIIDSLEHRERNVGGHVVRAFKGYSGTQAQEPEAWTERMFYYRGRMETLLTVPREGTGLPSIADRVEQFKLFSQIKEAARGLQAEMNRAAGLDTDVAIHYATALHIVVKENAVQLRAGDETVASVFIGSNGMIRVRDEGYLSDALSEQFTAHKNLFSKYSGVYDAEQVEKVVSEMRAAIFGGPDMEKWTLATREQRAEMEERIKSGFEKVVENNIDLAAKDVMQMQTRFSEQKYEMEVPNALAYSHIWALTAAEENKADALDKRIAELRDTLDGIEVQIQENPNLTEDEVNRLRNQSDNVSREFHQAVAARNACVDNIERFNDLRNWVTNAEHVTVPAGTLSMSDVNAWKQAYTRAEAADILPKLFSQPVIYNVDMKQIQLGPADPSLSIDYVQASKYVTEDRASLEVRPLTRAADTAPVVASDEGIHPVVEKPALELEPNRIRPEDHVLSTSNGVSVVERDGLKAYANQAGEIFSKYYKDLQPFGNSYGMATDGNGNKNLILGNGAELSPVWFKQMYMPTEGMILIRTDQGFNHVDMAKGTLVCDEWAPYARQFHDGWAVVAGGKDDGPQAEGKFNFINREGQLLDEHWFDRVTDFVNGKARFMLDGREGVIDKNRNIAFLGQEAGEEVKTKLK